MDFVYFLGRFHVLALHLPIGILLIAAALEVLGWRRRDSNIASITPLVWGIGAATAVITVALGWMHSLEPGFDGPDLAKHRWWGVSVAVLSIGVWLAKVAPSFSWRRRAVSVGSLAVTVALFITGHYGGNLTHGGTYLIEYAPAPLRAWAGHETRVAVTDLASADPYQDIVAPLLAARCQGCHNDSKRRGGLSMASYESLMSGGKSGKTVVAGDSTASDLVRRISLPPSHADFMPSDGKAPLSDAEVKAIGWWIAVGAPEQGKVAEFKVDDDVQPRLEDALGLKTVNGAPMAATTATSDPIPAIAAAPAAAIAALQAMGARVRPVAIDSPLLDVDFSGAGHPAGEDLVDALTGTGEQIARLNLRGVGVDDGMLAAFPVLPNVTELNLAENPLTDGAAGSLARFPRLKILNLFGTQMGDAGIAALADIATLERVYVWKTRESISGMAALSARQPKLVVVSGVAITSARSGR